jgi:hypothetical protein
MNSIFFINGLWISVLIIVFLVAPTIGGIVERIDPETFHYDERLRYSVTYLGIRIGTIEVKNRYDDYDTDGIGETVVTMRTFSGIPFFSVYTEFYNQRGSDGFFTKSTTFDRERTKWAYYHALREDKSTEIIVNRGYRDRENGRFFDIEIDTLYPGFFIHDALTFISILRDSASTDRNYVVPVLIDRSVEQIRIDPPGKTEKIEVRAFENGIKAYYITGEINFTAIHGLTRRYQSWISTDKYRIPLKARVRIAIGSINIELEEYESTRK